MKIFLLALIISILGEIFDVVSFLSRPKYQETPSILQDYR